MPMTKLLISFLHLCPSFGIFPLMISPIQYIQVVNLQQTGGILSFQITFTGVMTKKIIDVCCMVIFLLHSVLSWKVLDNCHIP